MKTRARKQLQSTAYHEAGHAVASVLMGIGFGKISIVPNEQEGTAGHVDCRPMSKGFNPDNWTDWRTRKILEGEIVALLAGLVAEGIFKGRRNWYGASRDRHEAVGAALFVCSTEEEAAKYLDWLLLRTKTLLSRPPYWAAIQVLAEMLMEKREIGSRQARHIIKDAMRNWSLEQLKPAGCGEFVEGRMCGKPAASTAKTEIGLEYWVCSEHVLPSNPLSALATANTPSLEEVKVG